MTRAYELRKQVLDDIEAGKTVKKIRLLEAELAALKAENEWQPIDTAPKDGAWIVVTSTHNKYYRACVQFYDGHWYDTQEVTHDDLMENAATHWMPLPKPPAMAQGEQGC